ncbi:unnamed protein product [Phytomonas sp. EM1]|nr:unnamed protein product [Phytomonas sp. EM1]|eukprot:CCW65722.1 unnamed protein product [Phytomonas sp. isolate EM1]
MDVSRIQEDNRFRSESPEQYRLDPPYTYSRYRSLSSSRFSSRVSHRSSARDEAQTLDEFLRKQRVIRYMEEERERAGRTNVLRDEHNEWIEFRATERFERLKYMNEQEIEDLLQREAEEALKEKTAAEVAAKRVAEETILRRRGFVEVRKSGSEPVVASGKSKTSAIGADQKAERNSAPKQVPSDEIEDARQLCLELRRREEELVVECNRLKDKLIESDRIAASAVRDREKAERELVREHQKLSKSESDMDSQAQLQRQVELLKKQLADLHGKFALTEVERKRLLSLVEEGNPSRSGLQGQLNNLKDKLRQMETEAEDSKRKLAALQEELVVKNEQIDQYKTRLKLVQKRSDEDIKYASPKVDRRSENDPEIHKKDKQEFRRLQKSMEKMRAELQRANQENDNLQRELNEARERPPISTVKVMSDQTDEKSVTVLNKKINNLLNDTNRNAATIQCLKNELQAVQEELQYETAARAKFEELAAQAIDRNGVVPEVELVKLKQQLKESDVKLREARAEADEVRRSAQEEIQGLKSWCARLRERQDKQMRDMELALQNVSADPKRNSHSEQKPQVPELRMRTATLNHPRAKPWKGVSASHVQNNGIQEQGKSRLEGSEVSFVTISSPGHDSRIDQMQLDMERLKNENAELQRKHNELLEQCDSLKFKQLTREGGGKSESKRGLYVEREVQTDSRYLEEPVLSTQPNILIIDKVAQKVARADALNANNTKLEGRITISKLMTAEERATKEVIEGNVDEVKMQVPSLPCAPVLSAEEESKKAITSSEVTETNPTFSSNAQQKRQRTKAKCGCH